MFGRNKSVETQYDFREKNRSFSEIECVVEKTVELSGEAFCRFKTHLLDFEPFVSEIVLGGISVQRLSEFDQALADNQITGPVLGM